MVRSRPQVEKSRFDLARDIFQGGGRVAEGWREGGGRVAGGWREEVFFSWEGSGGGGSV